MSSGNVATQRPLALVTGASGGIGLALAQELAGQGYDLVVASDDEDIRRAAEQLLARGVVVHPVRADLATFEGVEELAAAARSTGRAVDVLAVTAGGDGDLAGDGELDAELRVVALNCAGSVHLAKRILPGMVERGAGRVLFTPAASPGSCHAVYAASMAFVAQLAQSLREELQDTGVTVTTLTPGPTDDDPADVAKEIVRGLMAGEDRVVVGAR